MTNIGSKLTWAIRLSIYGAIIYGVYYFASAYSNSYIRDRGSKFCYSIFQGGDIAGFVISVLKPPEVVLIKGVLDGVMRESDEFIIHFAAKGPFKGFDCKISTKNGQTQSKEFYEVD